VGRRDTEQLREIEALSGRQNDHNLVVLCTVRCVCRQQQRRAMSKGTATTSNARGDARS